VTVHRRAEAQAADPIQTAFTINDADPVSSVPTLDEANKKPLEMGYFMMLLSERAEAAQKAGRFGQAAQYYRAMAKAVPDVASNYSRACRAHAAAKEWDKAIEVCREALGTEGVKPADLILYVHVMLDSPHVWQASDVEDVGFVLERLRQELTATPADQLTVTDIECRVATRVEDPTRLRACNAAMARPAPDSPKTLVYASAQAVRKHDWAEVERVIERARHAGVPADTLAALEKVLAARRSESVVTDPAPDRTWIFLGAVITLALITAAWRLRGRRRRVAVQP
jgi:tetratricopeptide (TPR) repeat protein